MPYLSLKVNASNNGGYTFAKRRQLVKKLNNIYYDEKKQTLSGKELKTLVCGRKLSYDWVENKYNSIMLIVHNKLWNVNAEKWTDMATFLNELYVGDQIREKIVDVKQEDDTYVLELDVFPFFDDDGL